MLVCLSVCLEMKGRNRPEVGERESCRLRGGVVQVRLWLKP